ncbi:MAG: transglycosylase SLT domain-containing protein [Fluviicola sp.]
MKIRVCILFGALISIGASAQVGHWEREMVAVLEAEKEHVILGPSAIQAANWDDLQHPRFWQQVMVLSPDSVLINVASNRQIVGKMASRDWNRRTDAQKGIFKDSVRNALGLTTTERINVTTGKSDFYRFDLVFESLPKGVAAFAQLGVDPWYAQSILLIESPGQIKKSSVGAYGPFQLMPSVARAMGLKVNKYVDERTDFYKSAGAAAKLISKTCIPSARSIAQKVGLTVDESAIWFRLLVMHVYHAGAGNVSAVVQAIGKVPTGEQLIQRMWNTTAASFGNSSQNYSQLALAAHLELADRLARQGKCMYACTDESN